MGKQLQYQHDFASSSDVAYDLNARLVKGEKILAILRHYFRGKLDKLTVLDLGCSTGALAYVLSRECGHVLATDIDQAAVDFASGKFQRDNLKYEVGNAVVIDKPERSFDVVICAHIYEHVPDAKAMMQEIHRVLKPGGVCYFAAGNRLELMEPHYHLPLLSVVPKWLGHIYIRLAGKAKSYYETHMTVWGLRRLVRNFECHDYTTLIIQTPQEFAATDVLRPGSLKHKIAKALSKWAYWLIPDYIWILRKT